MAEVQATQNIERLQLYKKELRQELSEILTYWEKYVTDDGRGGFYGSVDNDNRPDKLAPKGVVMNARICWAFSAGFNLTCNKDYLLSAKRAFDYIQHNFLDKEYGGVYWSVNNNGEMLDGKKQIYGLAFCIYALAEYYKAFGEEIALEHAKDLFEIIERYSHDKVKGGYIEAFARDWQEAADLRLSEKDDNERKTMNTHLHVIEAYANLYRVWPDTRYKICIQNLLDIFRKNIFNSNNNHYHLFLDDDWNVRSGLQSYGHDIEAAWLLQQCAEVIDDPSHLSVYREMAVKTADAAAEGLDQDGGLWYEYEPADHKLIKEKHSWPQAEAMIGFFNAWQLTGSTTYLDQSIRVWDFVKTHIRDTARGEWFWGVYADYSLIEKDKAGFWKCPYHNSRACIEIINRLTAIGM